MNKFSIFLVLISVIFLSLVSCKKDKIDPDDILIGTWKLSEILADPGDGTGTFVPVDSDKKITFKTNSKIISNGNLCNISADTTTPTEGNYSIDKFTFVSENCNNPDYEYSFVIEGNEMIITYPCIEGCKAKYHKID